MSRCIVVGGSGFIGRYVTAALNINGFRTYALDRMQGAGAFIAADLADRNSLASALSEDDIIIHLAWSTVPQSSTNNPVEDVTSNIVGSINLFDVCIKCRVHKIIFISTGGAIYGIPQYLPIKESHPIDPISSYGLSKAAVEGYLKLYSRLYGINYVILRPGNAYGAGQRSSGGQGVIAACLNALHQHNTFEVWGDGTFIRDYVHVADIAQAVVLAARTQNYNAVYNIGSGIGQSVNQIISRIENITGHRVPVRYETSRKIDAPANILDSSRAAALLSWNPMVSLDDGIRQQWSALEGGDSDFCHL